MNLYKTARKFAFKLAAGEDNVKSRIKQVFDSGMKLTSQNIIKLWLNASDLTGGYEEIITDPLYAIRQIVQSYYNDMNRFGLSKENNINYITKLKAQINELEAVKLERGLDPRANGIFGGFREAVYAVPQTEVSGKQRSAVNLPDQKIDDVGEHTGVGYSENSNPSTVAGPFSLRDFDRWNS